MLATGYRNHQTSSPCDMKNTRHACAMIRSLSFGKGSIQMKAGRSSGNQIDGSQGARGTQKGKRAHLCNEGMLSSVPKRLRASRPVDR